MAHAACAYELFEITGYELRPIIGDDPRVYTGKTLPGSLDVDLHLGLFHALADLPVHDMPAVAVQDRTQVVGPDCCGSGTERATAS